MEKYLPFDEFISKFNLKETSTEKANEITMNLSMKLKEDCVEGLKLLCAVDDLVIQGFTIFIPQLISLVPFYNEQLNEGGRIFLIGSGCFLLSPSPSSYLFFFLFLHYISSFFFFLLLPFAYLPFKFFRFFLF